MPVKQSHKGFIVICFLAVLFPSVRNRSVCPHSVWWGHKTQGGGTGDLSVCLKSYSVTCVLPGLIFEKHKK